MRQAYRLLDCALIWLRLSRGVKASGSTFTSIKHGRDMARQRSKAGSNPAVAVTNSPCSP